jgi:hypothetical protein
MKGKIYKYDGKSQKMVEVSDASMMPLGEFKADDGTKIGFGLIAVPRFQPEMGEQERENLKQVLRKADQYAEAMDRRDCVRVQEQISEMRAQYGIDE